MNVQPLFRSDHHPALVTPAGEHSPQALCEYLSEDRAAARKLLLQHGALLFRDFGLHEPADLRSCAESFGAEPFGYVGGNSPRTLVAENVYTSTEYPATETISLHNEMSYLGDPPRRLFFLSLLPALSGGQTALAHGRDVLSALPPQIVAKFGEKGLRYVRNFHPGMPYGKSWQDTYSTSSRSEAEAKIRAQGSTCSWSADGALRVSTECPALSHHPVTGERVWFNQAEQWHPSSLARELRMLWEQLAGKGSFPHDCEYADGEPIEESALAEIRSTLQRCKLLFDWRRGDLLVIDNFLMMHGREPFTGKRNVLTYLSST